MFLYIKKLKNDKILPIHRVTGVNLATRNKDKMQYKKALYGIQRERPKGKCSHANTITVAWPSPYVREQPVSPEQTSTTVPALEGLISMHGTANTEAVVTHLF